MTTDSFGCGRLHIVKACLAFAGGARESGLGGAMEHRWGNRTSVALKVRLMSRTGAVGAGYLRDVSISGAYLQTALRLPSLASLKVIADSNSWGACVVRCDASGMGIEWDEFASAEVVTLLRPEALTAALSGEPEGRAVELELQRRHQS